MSKYVINDTTLIGIGDAIRAKGGTTDKILVSDLATAITNLPTGGSGGSSDEELKEKLQAVIRHPASYDNWPEFTITAEELNGLTKIGSHAFYNNDALVAIELPEGLLEISDYAFHNCDKLNRDTQKLVLPSTLISLGNNCFQQCYQCKTVKILNENQVVSVTSSYDPFANIDLAAIEIPSKLYNEYCAHTYWKKYKSIFQPWGEWVFKSNLNGASLFNATKEYSIQLSSFDSTPEFSIVSSNPEVATVSDIAINADNTEITFKINSLTTEGTTTITATIHGNERTYEFTGTYTVYEVMPESTYEVVATANDATYGFALNDAGYWESQNKGKGGTAAVCQINLSNLVGKTIYLDCINYAESSYDYGILGAVNQTLATTYIDDSGVKKSFKGLSKADIQTVEYTDAIGSCFIQVKFRKDGSGDQNNDTLQFKVRFGE